MRKTQHKSRKYIRALLDVIRTYEELPMTGMRPHRDRGYARQQEHQLQDQVGGEGGNSSSEAEDLSKPSIRHQKELPAVLVHRPQFHEQLEHQDKDHHPRHRHTQSSPEWRSGAGAGDLRSVARGSAYDDVDRHAPHSLPARTAEMFLREAQEARR